MTGGRQAVSDPAGAGRRPHRAVADGDRPSRTEAAGSEAERTGVAPARRTARPMYVRLAFRRVRHFRLRRRAGWGMVAKGWGREGSPGDPTDALPVPIPLTCAPQGVSEGPCSVGCRSDVVPTWAWWSGEGLGVRGHLQAWATFGLAK